jgi:hypothetical protein
MKGDQFLDAVPLVITKISLSTSDDLRNILNVFFRVAHTKMYRASEK